MSFPYVTKSQRYAYRTPHRELFHRHSTQGVGTVVTTAPGSVNVDYSSSQWQPVMSMISALTHKRHSWVQSNAWLLMDVVYSGRSSLLLHRDIEASPLVRFPSLRPAMTRDVWHR
ncbi:MAG: hypothetical protein M5R41_07150 [Bacteroidia bacterium]|nr:hypothetical protein [Bacteroidia bacterium]